MDNKFLLFQKLYSGTSRYKMNLTYTAILRYLLIEIETHEKTTLAMSALALSLGLALSPLSATAAETSSSAMTAQQMPSPAPMLEKVMPSVVSINVEGSTTVNTPRMPRNFQQFFGDDSRSAGRFSVPEFSVLPGRRQRRSTAEIHGAGLRRNY